MDLNFYAVRDEKMDLSPFGAVVTQENDEVAMRNFFHECMNKDSMWHTHPSDFSLWHIGDYETTTGEIVKDLYKVCDAPDYRKEK